MSTKPPVRRYFNELYHYNHNHDPKTGRFTGSGRGRVYDDYIDSNGKLTDKAKARLNVGSSGSSNNTGNSSGSSGDSNSSGDNSGKKKDKNNNNNNNNDKKSNIRVDQHGRVVPEDSAAAMSQIEKSISQDYVSKSKALKDASTLTSQASSLLASIRKNRTSAEAQSIDLSNMTDKELNDYINRKALESRYRSVMTSDADLGHTTIENFLTYGGAALSMAATVATIAATIHAIRS